MASRKLTATAAVVAILAVAYSGSAWYFGKQIEAAHASIDTRIAAVPYLKLVRHDYVRDLFGAREVITLELAPMLFPVSPSPTGAPGGDSAPTTRTSPLQISIQSTIKHGPFPGFDSLAAGRAETTLVFDEAIQKELDKAFAGKPAVNIATLYQMAGGGRSQISSPAFKTELTAAETGKKALLSGDGVEMTLNFSRDFEQYDVHGSAPRFAVSDATGSELEFSGLGLEARQKRVFADEPQFYAGSAQFSLAAMKLIPGAENAENAPAIALKNLVYALDVPLNGDYLDLVGKIGASEFSVNQRNYGPARYDFSLRHLHARKLADINRKMMDFYSSPEKFQDTTQIFQVLEPLKGPLLELLADNPRFNIERLSFHTPDGDAALSATLGLSGATALDFANPMTLLPKIDFTADLAFPATLMETLQSGADEEEMAARKAAVERSLAAFVRQGYATSEAGMIKSKVVFDGKQLLVNGKLFNPMSLAQSR